MTAMLPKYLLLIMKTPQEASASALTDMTFCSSVICARQTIPAGCWSSDAPLSWGADLEDALSIPLN